MPRPKKTHREYRFEIDAYTPETIPMSRLAQYLGDLAKIMGEDASVHFVRVDKGSTVPVVQVDWEAEPKVRERIRAVKFDEGPAEPRRAYRELNRRLIEDNARGTLIDPGKSKVLRFPGRAGATQPEFGPFNQAGSLIGVPIKVGGENDPVTVHLDDGKAKHILSATRAIAKEIAEFLFTGVVRIDGIGRWYRNRMGEWELHGFNAKSVTPIADGDVIHDVEKLRAIPADWKGREDPIGELLSMRSGQKVQ